MISRVNTSWVIPVERPLVGWLAAKLPVVVTPDHLTLTGFAGALICGLAYGASWISPAFLWLASAGLIINWFGDSLDGTLARFRKIERPRYGFFIDNTTDLLSQICIFLGLGVSRYMRFDVACLGLAVYYIVSFFNLIKAMHSHVIKIGFFGIGPTEIRLGFICYNFFLLTIGPWSVNTSVGPISPIDGIVIAVIAVVLISLIVTMCSEGRRLAQEEVSFRAEQARAEEKSTPRRGAGSRT
jgi:phosphatidylglycerophosphate synthase